MEKITVEKVLDAYKSKGLRPVFGKFGIIKTSGHWASSNNECCALGALMCGQPVKTGHRWSDIESTYDVYTPAFTNGFDGKELEPMNAGEPGSGVSYELGKACREAVLAMEGFDATKAV